MAEDTKKKRGGRRGARTLRGSLSRAEEIDRALRLVRAGYTVRDISNVTGWSRGKAHNLVAEGRAAIAETAAKELLAEIVDRERALIKAHWKNRGDPEHAKVIQLSDKVIIATLPTKTEVTGKGGGPIVTYDLSKLTDAQLERLADGDVSALVGGDARGAADPGARGD